MKRVLFHRFAERDLAAAVGYYERERPGLGSEFRAEVERAIGFLSRYPLAAPVVRGEVRRFVVARFPYSLLYRQVAPDALRILAVAHHKRDPDYWVGRE